MSDAGAMRSLGDKFRRLDLDPPEAVALAAILMRARAAEAEVEGFGFGLDVGSLGFGSRTAESAGFEHGIRPGDGTAGFKGTDEELQAIVDWLGSR